MTTPDRATIPPTNHHKPIHCHQSRPQAHRKQSNPHQRRGGPRRRRCTRNVLSSSQKSGTDERKVQRLCCLLLKPDVVEGCRSDLQNATGSPRMGAPHPERGSVVQRATLVWRERHPHHDVVASRLHHDMVASHPHDAWQDRARHHVEPHPRRNTAGRCCLSSNFYLVRATPAWCPTGHSPGKATLRHRLHTTAPLAPVVSLSPHPSR
mmetsp:Transcript_35722/g.82975  ORF Transcript_35722/g.82975 Transcript_35722/m.82975 type:complete len:208 (-) Transcript_35722:987-1610(-)